MSNVFFISDTHFGHANIIQYGNRPFADVTEMNQEMVLRWNSAVTKRDTVYHLGDLGMGKESLELIKHLNGRKILIIGNHDTLPMTDYIEAFSKVHAMLTYKGYWLTHCPMHPNELFGKKNIHGHIHNKTIDDERYINVSVEQINYTPMPFERIVNGTWKNG
jgi:calcineurin-like phosphoesterase family protein